MKSCLLDSVGSGATSKGSVFRLLEDGTGNPADPHEVSFSVPLVLGVGDHATEVFVTDDEGNTETALVVVHAVPVDDAPPRGSNVVADPDSAGVEAPVRRCPPSVVGPGDRGAVPFGSCTTDRSYVT